MNSCSCSQKCEVVEVCQKSTYQVELDKGDTHLDYGVKIEAELAEDNDREDELRIYVAEVRMDSLAHTKGMLCLFLFKVHVYGFTFKGNNCQGKQLCKFHFHIPH